MIPDQRAAAAVAALRALDTDGRLPDPELPYVEVLRQPHEFLGPFEALPQNLRAYLRALHGEEEAVRNLADGRLSRALITAGGWVSRALYSAEHAVARVEHRGPAAVRGPAGAARVVLRRTARQSARLPFSLRRRLQRAAARWRLRLGRRDLGTVLRARAFDVHPLGYDYLEGVPQVHGCESVFARPQARATYALLIGLDFVQSGGKFWFLEANWNPSLMDARLELYESGRDPWVHNILEAVRASGSNRLVVYGYRPFSLGHANALAKGGSAAGIEVEIVDDFFAARHAGHQRAWLMQNGATHDAFVMRAKGFDVLFDHAILSKRRTRAIVASADIDWADVGAALPPLITPGDPAPGYLREGRYPNLVAKIDGLDRGAGVSFFKTPVAPADLAGRVDYCEQYLVPDPCPFRVVRGEQVPLADGDRAWKIRTFALLTPDRVRYLSSIKVISGLRVPPVLPDGEVAQKRVFLVTINEGGFYSAVTPAEDQSYARASEAIGGALLSWLGRKCEVVDAASGNGTRHG